MIIKNITNFCYFNSILKINKNKNLYYIDIKVSKKIICKFLA